MQFHCTICSKQSDLWKDVKITCVIKCGHVYHLNCLTPKISSQSKLITMECPNSTCQQRIKKTVIINLTEGQKSNAEKNEPIGCNLCNEPLTDTDDISLTNCGHIYGSICLEKLVRWKSHACFVPSCKKKITLASVTKLQGVSDVTGDGDESFRLKIEPKSTNSPKQPSKRVTFADQNIAIAQVPADPSEESEVRPGCSKSLPHSPILNFKKPLDDQKNYNFSQKIKLDLKREIISNTLDGPNEQKNEDLQNKQIIIMLKQKCEALEEKIQAFQREQKEMKNETTVWEMCYKYLKDNAQGTEMMIPNETTLDIMRENERLKMKIQELERERNDAKKETKVWEMSFACLQNTFKDTDIMIPDEKTLELVKENETLKMCIADLGRELVATKKNVNSAETLRAEFENYIEENLNLKNENEEMKRDLKMLKEEMNKLDGTITELVIRHSQESETVNELNDSFMNENTELNTLNKNLQEDKNKLNALNETLKKENSELIEVNRTLEEENKNLNEQNKSLQNGNNELIEFNDTLLAENTTLSLLNQRLQSENNKLTEDNNPQNNELPVADHSLRKENAKLKELNKTLQKETNMWKDFVISLQKQKKLNESNTKDTTDELNEPNQSLPVNTCSNELNELLKKQLNELVTSMQGTEMQEENNKLNEKNSQQNDIKLEENDNFSKENIKLNELNETLHQDNARLNEVNETLHKDNETLHKANENLNVVNETLHKDNDNLNEVNKILHQDNDKLNEVIETLHKDNDRLNEVNESSKNEKNKLNESNIQKEKLDYQWSLISRRSFCNDCAQGTRKRRASEMSQVIDLVNGGITNKSTVHGNVLNKEIPIIDLVNRTFVNKVNKKDLPEKGVTIVDLVNIDIGNKRIVKDVIKDDVRIGTTSNDVEFVKEEMIRKYVKEPKVEAENVGPQAKRTKLPIDADKEFASSSSSMKI